MCGKELSHFKSFRKMDFENIVRKDEITLVTNFAYATLPVSLTFYLDRYKILFVSQLFLPFLHPTTGIGRLVGENR